MNVKKLKSILSKLPDHTEVMVFNEDHEFPCRPVRDAKVRMVEYREDSSEPSMAKDKALVITFD